jgi:hypothetical protein
MCIHGAKGGGEAGAVSNCVRGKPTGVFGRRTCMLYAGGLVTMVWYGMVWYGMVWYGMVWYGMVWLVAAVAPGLPGPTRIQQGAHQGAQLHVATAHVYTIRIQTDALAAGHRSRRGSAGAAH